MDQACDGQPAIVTATGVPGAGKTALLRWIHDAAVTAGMHVLRSSVYESPQPLDLLRRLFVSLPRAHAMLAHPSPRALGPGERDGYLADVAEAAMTELSALGRRRPTVVLIDDIPDADPGSQLVLEQAIAELDATAAGGGTNILMALSAREPAENDGLMLRAARYDICRSVSLGGLDEHEVHEMLAQAGLRVTPALVSRVMEDTGGLPLLVEADLEMQRARRRGPATGHHRNARVRSMADAMQARIGQVDAPTQQLLAHATVLGEPWDPEDLFDLVDMSLGAARQGLDRAVGAHLVEALGDGTLRFAHPLVRTELLNRLGKTTQRTLHRSIAERLGATHDDDRTLFRVADHLVRARPDVDPVVLATTTMRAGRRALQWGSWHQASRFLSAAVDAQPDDMGAAERAALLVDAGEAAYFDHDPARCRDHLVATIALAEALSDADLRLRAATQLALARNASGEVQVGVRPPVGELEAALADSSADPALRVDGSGVLADTLLASGETERALAIVAEARATAAACSTGGGGGRSLAEALSRLEFSEGIHRLVGLDLDDAAACFARGVEHATAAANPRMALPNRARSALVTLLQGDVLRATSELEAIEDQAMEWRYWGEAGLAAAERAACLALTGDPAAVDAVERSAHMYRRTGFDYIAVGLVPIATAIEARTRGSDGGSEATTARLGLSGTSALAVLSALEADDVAAAEARLRTSSWRHGFRGAATLAGLTVLAAMVEAGDRLGHRDLVAGACGPLTDAYESGLVVLASWPTTVPRLLAVTARHAGDTTMARRYLDHALALCERQSLLAEHPKILLELAQVEMAGGGSPAADALLTQAVARFDRLSLHGWISRCEAVARDLGLAPRFGRSRVAVRERTIFTDDIVGSTLANARLGDALYLEQLRTHDRIVRAAIRQHHGLEIKHTGDGVNAVFDSSVDAVRCAAAVQADFALWKDAEPDLALQVRCGLARGRLLPHEGDFYGLVQSEAARLCTLAAPGEALASASVIDDVDDVGLDWEAIGPQQLRGLPAVTVVHRLVQ